MQTIITVIRNRKITSIIIAMSAITSRVRVDPLNGNISIIAASVTNFEKRIIADIIA